MSAKVEMRLAISNRAIITIAGDNEKEVIERAAFFDELPQDCPICGSSIVFTFRQPSGYTYYGMKCMGSPSHETNFGQHKEGGSLYYKGEWKEAFSANPDNARALTSGDSGLDSEIEQYLRLIGKSHADLNAYAATKFKHEGKWQTLDVAHKRAVVVMLAKKAETVETF